MTLLATEAPDIADLQHVPLFANLSAPALTELAASFRPVSVDAHQVVMWFGEPGDTFYVIAKGHVSVSVPNEQGQERELNRLSRGGFFGELSLLDGGPRTATVRAIEPTTLLVLGRHDFAAFIDRHPETATAILVVMAQRQRQSLTLLREQPNPAKAFEPGTSIWAQGAARIVEHASQWWFMILHVCVFSTWFGVNILASKGYLPAWLLFDEVYAFNKFKMFATVEAMILTMLVLATQRASSARDRAKAEIEYQINLKAQTQISQLMHKVDDLQSAMSRLTGIHTQQEDPDTPDLVPKPHAELKPIPQSDADPADHARNGKSKR